MSDPQSKEESDECGGSESDSDTASEDEESIEIEIDRQISEKSILSTYIEFLSKGYLLLQPEYQRDLCWTSEKMCALIDTIMRNWIISTFVIYQLSKSERTIGSHFFECIDGQHRLTSLKWFIEGKKDEKTGRYICWKKGRERIFYNLPEEELKKMSKNVKARNFTSEEKHHFDNYILTVQIIKSSGKLGIPFSIKCMMFNRLQNGERVSTYDKLKNLSNNILCNVIREHKLVSILLYNIKIQENLLIKKMNKYEGFIFYFLVRTLVILDKSNLMINYLDLNIKNSLVANEGTGTKLYQIKNNILVLIPKMNEVLNFIKNLSSPILPELVYIYICIYPNFGIEELKKVVKYFTKNTLQFKKFNSLKNYQKNGITTTGLVENSYEEIIKLVLNISIKDDNNEIEI